MTPAFSEARIYVEGRSAYYIQFDSLIYHERRTIFYRNNEEGQPRLVAIVPSQALVLINEVK